MRFNEVFGFATKNQKTTTVKKKKVEPTELSLADRLKQRRAMAAQGDSNAFKSGVLSKKNESQYTDLELAIMEGGHSIEDVQGVAENFADGKVKGKSRPGRVKRAGASCAGSVTDLRAKAKKYSGEKAKMYHWCANMKGGKK